MAGAIAGSATVLITNPIWVVNTRMTAMASTTKEGSGGDVEAGEGGKEQADRRKKKASTLATLYSLCKDEGMLALFAGVLPALVLVINPILQYTIFEQLRDWLERRRKAKGMEAGLNAWHVFLLGAIGKLAATSITYPYITVKSRMHVAKKGDGGTEGKEGMGASLRRVVREEGWSGLYKGQSSFFSSVAVKNGRILTRIPAGIGPKVTQSVITAAFLFAFKDALYAASVRARNTIPAKLPVK